MTFAFILVVFLVEDANTYEFKDVPTDPEERELFFEQLRQSEEVTTLLLGEGAYLKFSQEFKPPLVGHMAWFIGDEYVQVGAGVNDTQLSLSEFNDLLENFTKGRRLSGGGPVNWIWLKNEASNEYVREVLKLFSENGIHTFCTTP